MNAKTDINYRHLHLRGAVGISRTEVFDGRTYTVVPVVALIEGVIFAVNADVPEYVPLKTLMMAPQGWNGRPVVLNHPSLNGRMISANTPGVLERKAFGVVFNTRVAGAKLLMEAWLDPIKAASIGELATDTVMRAASGTPVEVSVGVYATVEDEKGTFNGKTYKATWVDMIPDHLALLSAGEIGACSNAMGCGVRTHLVTAKGMECSVIEECPTKTARRSLRERVVKLITADTAVAAPVEGSTEEEGTENPDQEIIEDAHLNSFPRGLYPYSVHQRGVKKPKSFHKTQSEAAAVAAANAKVKRVPHVVVNRATGQVVERSLRERVMTLVTAGGAGSGWFAENGHVPEGGRNTKAINQINKTVSSYGTQKKFPQESRDEVKQHYDAIKSHLVASGFTPSSETGAAHRSDESATLTHPEKGSFKLSRDYFGVIPGDYAKGYRGQHYVRLNYSPNKSERTLSNPEGINQYTKGSRVAVQSGHWNKTLHGAAGTVHSSATSAQGHPTHYVKLDKGGGEFVHAADLKALGGVGSGRYPKGSHATAATAHEAAAQAHDAAAVGNTSSSVAEKATRVASKASDEVTPGTAFIKRSDGLREANATTPAGKAIQAAYQARYSEKRASSALGPQAARSAGESRVKYHQEAANHHREQAAVHAGLKTLGDNPGHDFHGNQYTAAQQESAAKITELQGHIRRIGDTVTGNTGASIRKRLALTKNLRAELEKHENIVDPTRHEAIAANSKLTPVKNEAGATTGYNVHHEGQHIGTIKPTTFRDFKMVNGAPQMARGHGYNAHASDGSLIMENLKKGEAVEYLAKAHSRKLRGLSGRSLRQRVKELMHESASA